METRVITIKNLRTESPTKPWQFRVDRTTPLGNPFHMRGESQRADVRDKYEALIRRDWHLETRERGEYYAKILSTLLDTGKVDLFCWCVPGRCHAESIKRRLETDAYATDYIGRYYRPMKK